MQAFVEAVGELYPARRRVQPALGGSGDVRIVGIDRDVERIDAADRVEHGGRAAARVFVEMQTQAHDEAPVRSRIDAACALRPSISASAIADAAMCCTPRRVSVCTV